MDNKTFNKELLHLQPSLYNYAIQLTLNKEEAQDLLQETSLRLLKNASKFITETNFKGWAITVMKNLFINNYRRATRIKMINDATPNDFLMNLKTVFTSETPEVAVSIKEINKVINSFDKDLRIPFKYYVAGYAYQEIADTLGIPLGTVKSRIYFARKKLQSLLKDFR